MVRRDMIVFIGGWVVNVGAEVDIGLMDGGDFFF